MRVMMSIRPEYASRIMSGEMRFEYRRRAFVRRDVDAILVYCTRPVSAVVGEVVVEGVLEGPPSWLWDVTGDLGGIGREAFMGYFGNAEVGYAIRLGAVTEYDVPRPVGAYAPKVARAPQSFVYLDS